MSKHTPGPWVIDGYEVSPKSNMDLAICSVMPMDWNGGRGRHIRGDETQANANLIAAAPDLLETLETIKRRLYEPRQFFLQEVEAMIDIAIARAKGESR